VADGASADPFGAFAAESAVAVAARVLTGSDLLEPTVLGAVDAACAAVEPWYSDREGGTTLTIATVTARRLVVASLGDSAAYQVVNNELRWVTPQPSAGTLGQWVGMRPRTRPWFNAWRLDPAFRTVVVLATDGLRLEGGRLPDEALDQLPTFLLETCRGDGDDDATVTVIALSPSVSAVRTTP